MFSVQNYQFVNGIFVFLICYVFLIFCYVYLFVYSYAYQYVFTYTYLAFPNIHTYMKTCVYKCIQINNLKSFTINALYKIYKDFICLGGVLFQM